MIDSKENHDDDQFFDDLKSRQSEKRKAAAKAGFLLGLMIFGVGLVLAGFQIGWPVYQAMQHAPEIQVSMKWSAGSVIVLVFGLGTMCGMNFLADPQNVSLKDFLIMAVMIAVGFAGWWGFKVYLESQGYHFPPL